MNWVEGLLVTRDQDDVDDWKFDWSDWLGTDTISSSVVAVESGLTKDSDSITDSSTSVTVWLSGGIVGSEYKVTSSIVTTAGREKDRSVTFLIVES